MFKASWINGTCADSTPPSPAGGFARADVLIALAVLGMLVALLATGMQALRESARRTICVANLRHVGLGLVRYHEANGCLPPASGGPDSTCTQWVPNPPRLTAHPAAGFGRASGFVMLLPYVDQMAAYEAIEAAGWPFINHPVYDSFHVPTFLCPSDQGRRAHNYLLSVGDRWTRLYPPRRDVPPAADAAFQDSLRGLFGFQSRVPFASIRDGLGNTIAVSECVTPTGLGRRVGGGEPIDGLTYQPPYNKRVEAVANDRFASAYSHHDDPSACLASLDGGRFPRGTIVNPLNQSAGIRYADGLPALIAFSTVLPPNGPRCHGGWKQGGLLTPRSRHPGGVCGLMADGAVRFIRDTIDTGAVARADVTVGPSPYGVWGALGSRAGDEGGDTLP